jgi:hypothetical protein
LLNAVTRSAKSSSSSLLWASFTFTGLNTSTGRCTTKNGCPSIALIQQSVCCIGLHPGVHPGLVSSLTPP